MAFARFRFACLTCVALVISSAARADSIYLFNPDGSPRLDAYWNNVTILRMKDGALLFRTASGTESSIGFDKIARLTVGADPVLTEADDAYLLSNFEKAVDGYLKSIRTNDAWKLKYITPRLATAAAKTKRFDASMTAYIGYAQLDPAAALQHKPALPAKGSKLLDEAAKQLDTALRTAGDNATKQALLSLLVDVQMTRADQAGAEAAASQLTALTGDQADPRIAAMLVGVKLDQAAAEITAGRFEKVAPLIDSVRGRLVEPRDQSKALFLLAQASRGAAGSDRKKLLDAAIAFMRVAAHFEAVEGKPLVGEALLEAAKTSGALGDTETTTRLCEQIEADFPATPIAAQAATLREQVRK